MSNDALVKQLRAHGLSTGVILGTHLGICDEAADAIEALEREIAAAKTDIHGLLVEAGLDECEFCKWGKVANPPCDYPECQDDECDNIAEWRGV